MERLKLSKDDEQYSTSRGRWAKYFFNQGKDEGLITIGETDDYFYFTLSLKEGVLKDKYLIEIPSDSVMYNPLNNVLNGFKLIDVFEEGSPERKSLCFEKQKDDINITFNLTEEERVFYTIEFANLRRLGDTRFRQVITQNGDIFDIEDERELRYGFKVRLHKLLDELEYLYSQSNENKQQL